MGCKVRSPPRVRRGRCGVKRHERSAGSGRGGTRVRNRGLVRKARAPLSGGGASSPPAQPCFPFPATQTAPVALERGHRDAGVARGALAAFASLSRYPLPPGAWAQPALGAAFSRPVRVSPFLPRPSPSFLLPWPFLSAELAFQHSLPASPCGLRPSTQLSLAFSPRE